MRNKIIDKKLRPICDEAFEKAWFDKKSFSDRMMHDMDYEAEVCNRVVLSLYELGYLKVKR